MKQNARLLDACVAYVANTPWVKAGHVVKMQRSKILFWICGNSKLTRCLPNLCFSVTPLGRGVALRGGEWLGA